MRLAMHALEQQRYSDAISHAVTASKQTPRDPEPWLVQAIAHSQTGDLPRAEQLSRKALELAPAHTGACMIMGNILQAQGKSAAAITAYKNAINQKPDFVEALNNLGSLMRSTGQLDEAEEYLKRALAVMPDNPVIMTNLGLVEKDRGNRAKAIELYRNTLRLHPDHADAHYNLANLLQMQGTTTGAEHHYRRAIECNPNAVMAMHGLGQLLSSAGRIDEALQMLERARTLQPDFQDISAAFADIYEKQGKYDMALEVLEPLLASQAISPGACLCFSKLAPRLHRHDEAISLLKHQLTNPASPPQIKTDIYFSLGMLFDSKGDFEKAFENFRLGNINSTPTTAAETGLAQLRQIKQLFRHDRQARAPRSGNTSSKPVFIVGMPRSGTTLVEQIVSSHPSITGAGELPYIGGFFEFIPGALQSYHDLPCMRR